MDVGAAARELALRLDPRIDDGCTRRHLAAIVAARGWRHALRYPAARVFVTDLETALTELREAWCGSSTSATPTSAATASAPNTPSTGMPPDGCIE